MSSRNILKREVRKLVELIIIIIKITADEISLILIMR